jgi:hypothetical protein
MTQTHGHGAILMKPELNAGIIGFLRMYYIPVYRICCTYANAYHMPLTILLKMPQRKKNHYDEILLFLLIYYLFTIE